MDYYEAYGGAIAKLSWAKVVAAATTPVTSVVTPVTPPVVVTPPPTTPAPSTIPTPTPTPAPTPTTPPTTSVPPGNNVWNATYYKGIDLKNVVLTRTDQNINFIWNNASPDPIVPVDQFSARWKGYFDFIGGNHTFSMTADDGARLYIDGQLVIDEWHDQPSTTYHVTENLPEGTHTIVMEYYEAYGGAIAKLSWD
jgi:hypothetical protein